MPQEQEKEKQEEQKSEQAKEGEGPKDLTEFAKKFSASRNAPVELGGDPESESNKERVESFVEGEKKVEEIKAEQKKRPGSNIPQLVEDKKKAEKERDELRAKLDEYETKTKPTLEKQVTDLQAKIDSGDFSAKKESEFQARIAELESKMTEREQAFVNEKSSLKKRLAFHDLSEDEDFRRDYFMPVVKAHTEAATIIGQDKKRQEVLQRALTANSMALRTQDPREREQAESERDSLLSSLADDLPTFSQGRFVAAMGEYISGSRRHAEALINHEETTKEIRKRANEIRDETMAKRYGTWTNTYEKMAGEFKEYDLSDDELKTAGELGLNVDDELKINENTARQTIAGKGEVTDAIHIIHQGRVLPLAKAKIAILQHENKELKSLIAKLRAGTTGGGEGQVTTPKKEAPNLESFLDRFRPGK